MDIDREIQMNSSADLHIRALMLVYETFSGLQMLEGK